MASIRRVLEKCNKEFPLPWTPTKNLLGLSGNNMLSNIMTQVECVSSDYLFIWLKSVDNNIIDIDDVNDVNMLIILMILIIIIIMMILILLIS